MDKHNGGVVHTAYESDIENETENRLRVSDNSQIAQLDAEALAVVAARSCPTASTINIDKSSRVHIGPKIVSVVQNVDNNEKVKGQILGLELVSLSKRTRRLRCSVAVFLCWAFIVAIILAFVIAYLVISAPPQRLDIGLNKTWYIRRAAWQARAEYHREGLKLPVRTVVIGHSATSYCNQKYQCISIVLGIQENHLRIWDDIGPNFLVGGTGLVFEGRGANLVGVMVKMWNTRIISVMFLGNYEHDKPDDEQFNNVGELLNTLVKEKVLAPDYELMGSCQINQAVSPGANVIARLKEFQHFNPKDLPLPRYLVSVVRNTSKAERIACAISLVVLIVCISLLAYFLTSSATDETSDEAPHAWNITREMWLAKDQNNDKMEEKYKPIRLVVINHSVSSECHSFRICAAEIRNLQGYFIKAYEYDIPYNFLIGNEGRVYEGRGWNTVGAHTKYFNRCSIGLGFIGDYRASSNTHSKPTQAQIGRMNMLLQSGVQNGYLHKDYVIVGSKDIRPSDSPGSNLYDIMQTWKHYNNKIYNNMTCEQIYEWDIEHTTEAT